LGKNELAASVIVICLLQLAPSALEHPETVLRDPVYYQLFKRMDQLFFQKYYDRLPYYTYEQVSVRARR
jgi:hypothetical protein